MDLQKFKKEFIPAVKKELKGSIKSIKQLKSNLRSQNIKFGDVFMTALIRSGWLRKNDFSTKEYYLAVGFDSQAEDCVHDIAQTINREDYTDGERSDLLENLGIIEALVLLKSTYNGKYGRHSVDRNDSNKILKEAIRQLKQFKKNL